jgi:hypothetical protein
MEKEFETEHGHVVVTTVNNGIKVTNDNDDGVFIFGDFNIKALTETDIDLLLWEYYDNL